MSRDQQRLFDYLQHILEAINRIQRYIEDIDEVSFLSNELIQDAVIRNLEIIGEASQNINRHYPEYVDQHEDIPFSFAYEMRNVLAHGYFKVDLEVVLTIWGAIVAFDEAEPYELTELGAQFVHYTMNDVVQRVKG